jgi:hypothetical protein
VCAHMQVKSVKAVEPFSALYFHDHPSLGHLQLPSADATALFSDHIHTLTLRTIQEANGPRRMYPLQSTSHPATQVKSRDSALGSELPARVV